MALQLPEPVFSQDSEGGAWSVQILCDASCKQEPVKNIGVMVSPKSLAGDSVLGTINWDSEGRKEKEGKVLPWSPAGRTVRGIPEDNPLFIHCVIYRGRKKVLYPFHLAA